MEPPICIITTTTAATIATTTDACLTLFQQPSFLFLLFLFCGVWAVIRDGHFHHRRRARFSHADLAAGGMGGRLLTAHPCARHRHREGLRRRLVRVAEVQACRVLREGQTCAFLVGIVVADVLGLAACVGLTTPTVQLRDGGVGCGGVGAVGGVLGLLQWTEDEGVRVRW